MEDSPKGRDFPPAKHGKGMKRFRKSKKNNLEKRPYKKLETKEFEVIGIEPQSFDWKVEKISAVRAPNVVQAYLRTQLTPGLVGMEDETLAKRDEILKQWLGKHFVVAVFDARKKVKESEDLVKTVSFYRTRVFLHERKNFPDMKPYHAFTTAACINAKSSDIRCDDFKDITDYVTSIVFMHRWQHLKVVWEKSVEKDKLRSEKDENSSNDEVEQVE